MPEEAVLSNFSLRERTYLRSLRKRQRSDITRLFDRNKHAPHANGDEVPFRMQVLQSHLPGDLRVSIFDDLQKCDHSDKFVNWVRKAIRLPLNVMHPRKRDCCIQDTLSRARQVMDDTIVGHDLMKREVLKILCQSATCGASYALGLEGPPGCGKTHFVRNSLAPALQLPYVSIPLGGASDASFLLGCTYSYEGSKEGRLASALVEAGCCNPVIHFDEVDKIPKTERGAEIESVLIHLVDPSQSFLRDKYFHGIDIDYSNCTFVFGYNDPENISPILLDRIKRIRMGAPDAQQREDIIAHHILPRVCRKFSVRTSLSRGAVDDVLSRIGEGEGMRNVEKYVEHVVSSAHLCDVLGTDATSVGLSKEVAVYEADEGQISAEFAKGVLGQLKMRDAAASAPPAGMYT